MQYSPKKLLVALGVPIALGLAACSSSTATVTPVPSPIPLEECQQPLIYRDSLSPGQGYGFFQGQETSSAIRRIQYRGGNNFAFLDDNGNAVVPEGAKPYANPDGSVRFRQGGNFMFIGRVYGGNVSFQIKITFESLENNKATINVAISECTSKAFLSA